jgi:hypothetical protein
MGEGDVEARAGARRLALVHRPVAAGSKFNRLQGFPRFQPPGAELAERPWSGRAGAWDVARIRAAESAQADFVKS